MRTGKQIKFTHLFILILFILACSRIAPLPSQEQEEPIPSAQPSAVPVITLEQPTQEALPAEPLFNDPLPAKVVYQFEKNAVSKLLFAEDGQNNIHLLWIDDNAGIMHSLLDPQGNWSAQPDVVDSAKPGADDYQFLSSPDGSVCAVWTATFGLVQERCWREGHWQEVVTLVEKKNEWIRFSAAFDPAGKLQMLEDVWNTGSFSINGVNPMGSQDPAFKRNTTFKFVIDAQGGYHLVIVWGIDDKSPYVLMYKYSGDQGKTWQPAIQLTGKDDDLGTCYTNCFQLVSDPLGNVHIVWLPYAEEGVRYRRWTPATGWGPTEQVFPSYNVSEVSLSVDRQGNPHVLIPDLSVNVGGFFGSVNYSTRRQDGSWTPESPVYLQEGNQYPSGLAVFVSQDGVVHFAWIVDGKALQYASYP